MRRFAAAFLLVLFSLESTGCYAWHQDLSPVPRLQGAKSSDRYRVTLTSGRVVDLTGAQVRGDSLFATADSISMVHGEVQHTVTPFGVPMAQVTLVERREFNGGGLALGVGLAGLLVAAVGALAGAAWAQAWRGH